MKIACAGTFLAAVLAGGPSVWGQEGPFEKLDANKDGVITENEVVEERAKVYFERALRQGDKDGDKKLTRDEFRAAIENREDRPREGAPRDGEPQTDRRREGDRPREGRPGEPARRPGGFPGRPDGFRPPAPPVIRALDADGDGELSKEEIEGAAKSLAKLDRNEDGKLSREEWGPAFPGGPFAGRPGEGRPGQPRPNGATDNRPRDGGPALAQFRERFRAMDANGDGKLSQEEAKDRIKENFAQIDANGDGVIDEAEVGARFYGRRAAGDQPDRPRPRREGDQPDRPRRDGDRPEPRRPPIEGDDKPKEE